ncbi:hypothetical protein ASE95_08060 [Sphingomonas sp. Leaf231]|nr:hypothetical protein ASE95_08060 [Sphingomonas sp. Leaf231]
MGLRRRFGITVEQIIDLHEHADFVGDVHGRTDIETERAFIRLASIVGSSLVERGQTANGGGMPWP